MIVILVFLEHHCSNTSEISICGVILHLNLKIALISIMKLLAQYVRSSLDINEKVIQGFYWPLVARIVSVS